MRTISDSVKKLLKAQNPPQAIRKDAAYYEAEDVLRSMGVRKDDGRRADAGETAVFARQLQYVKTQTYDIRYPNLKARLFIPVDNSVPSGAESFVWRSYDWAGMASIIANFADDFPMVEVMGAEVIQGCKSIGDAYAYSIQDVRAATFGNTQLDVRRPQAARRAIENKIEQLAALGNSAAGLPGFLNNSNVPVLTAGGAITGNWASATPAQILADLHYIANSIVNTTNGVHAPNTMILPIALYNLIATTVVNNVTSETILTVFLKNSPYIRNVDQWVYLATAGAANATRIVCYDRSPEMLGLVIPQEFETFAPQARNLSFTVPCHARVGGVSIHYPLSLVYADGC